MLNSDNKFTIINTKYATDRYYPHLKWPSCMPKQDKINCVTRIKDNLSFLSCEVIDDGDTQKIIKLKAHNKSGANIDEIKINGLEVLHEKLIHTDDKCKIEGCIAKNGEYCRKFGDNIKDDKDWNGFTQFYENGISTVYAKVEIKKDGNEKYVSQYNLNSISTVKSITYGERLNATYNDNEYPLNIEFYYLIEDTDSIKRIENHEDENYKLINDIECKDLWTGEYILNNEDILTNLFTGKFDGNGYSINDLNIPLFLQTREATIKNLILNKYKPSVQKIPGNGYNFIGLIGITSKDTIIDNVHISYADDIELESANNLYIGGIIGYIDIDVKIQNSSTTNFNIKFKEKASFKTARIGGIVGYVHNSAEIFNCFARNVEFELGNNVKEYHGVGGIVGNFRGTRNANENIIIENCYSTGNITSENGTYMAGILGRNNELYVKLNNCYSTMNIISKTGGYNSGIHGYYPYDIKSEYITLENNIYLGNLFSLNLVDSDTKKPLNRILGSLPFDDAIMKKNYGFNEQLINGIAKEEENNSYVTILTREQIENKIKNNEILTDYYGDALVTEKNGNTKVYLPKLYYTDKEKGFLPNQDDLIPIPKDENPKILSVTTHLNDESLDENTIKITLRGQDIDFNSGESSTGISFKGGIEGYIDIVDQITTQDTILTIKIKKIDKYIDTYILTELIDTNRNKYSYNLPIELRYYIEINSIVDWNKYFTNSNYIDQNFLITNNIDLSSFEKSNNIQVNRIVGKKIGEDENGNEIYPTISNYGTIQKPMKESLFANIKKEMVNLNFENICINNDANSTDENLGIISIVSSSCKIENLKFNNISITNNKPTITNTGIIGILSSQSSVKNVYMNDINIVDSDNYYTGGLVGVSDGAYDITDITLVNSSVKGKHNVGGIIGYCQNWVEQSTILPKNLIVKNSTISRFRRICRWNYVKWKCYRSYFNIEYDRR